MNRFEANGVGNDAHEDRRAALDAGPPARLRVQKTYKLFVGGQFVRSESGRYRQVRDAVEEGEGAAENTPRASRKDARDAVNAALAALGGWSAKTAYNRGQIVYRLAEVVESRAGELASELTRGAGLKPSEARAEVDATVDRIVTMAGWSDKFQSLLCSSNPVAGPHFNFSVPEPMGVVALVAPSRPSLLGLVTAVLPIIVAGNTCVALVSEVDPRTPLTFAECLATSDMPGGVINLLSGGVGEVAPHLAKHFDVAALDLWAGDEALREQLIEAAASNVKRVRSHDADPGRRVDDEVAAGLGAIEAFVELKTIWHPVGV